MTGTWSTACSPARAAPCACPARCRPPWRGVCSTPARWSTATTAAAWGLVSHVAPAAELDATVDALVARLARHGPDALVRMKRMHHDSAALPPAQALAAERVALVEHLMTSPEAAEGLAAFRAGREPVFTHVARPIEQEV